MSQQFWGNFFLVILPLALLCWVFIIGMGYVCYRISPYI